jgi:hypothetical protein
MVVQGDARLTTANRSELWRLLTTAPRPLWDSLQRISVDGVGFNPQDLNGISCVSGADDQYEDPFPSDPIGARTLTTVFYAVCSHELTHQVDVTISRHRPLFRTWAAQLLQEAGCDPPHYLRSQMPPCFFRDTPQEFIASMGNQWFADSAAVWRLAYSRWLEGNPHPAQQAAFLTALFGMDPWDSQQSQFRTVAAFQYTPRGVQLTPWQVHPWQCGGDVTIVGADLHVRLTLDDTCRVTALDAQ